MKTLLFVAAAFAHLQAAGITQISSCTYDGVTTTGTASCLAGGPGVTVFASTTSTPSGDYNSGEIIWRWTGSVSRIANSGGTGHTGFATATITGSQDFYTAGSARSGFAFIQSLLDSDGGSGGSVFGLGDTVGSSYSTPPCALGIICSTPAFLPFDLGVPFTLTLGGGANSGLGDAAFSGALDIQLYEADRTTKVGVAVVTPEPASLALLGLGCVVLALRKMWLRL